MSRQAITSSKAKSIGPYSHAIDAQGLVFLSGQLPLDPATGQIIEGGIAEQTQQCFTNLFAVLEAAGLTAQDVQKVNIYLCNMDDFAGMNEVYSRQFSAPYPARTTIGIAALPQNARIEIELIAQRPA